MFLSQSRFFIGIIFTVGIIFFQRIISAEIILDALDKQLIPCIDKNRSEVDKSYIALKIIEYTLYKSNDNSFVFIKLPYELRRLIYEYVLLPFNYLFSFKKIESINFNELSFIYEDKYTIYLNFPFLFQPTEYPPPSQNVDSEYVTLIKPYERCGLPKKLKTILNDWLCKDDEAEADMDIDGSYGYIVNPFFQKDKMCDTYFILPRCYFNILNMLIVDQNSDYRKTCNLKFEYPIISAHILTSDRLLIESIDETVDSINYQQHASKASLPTKHYLAIYSITGLKKLAEDQEYEKHVDVLFKEALSYYSLPLKNTVQNSMYILGSSSGPEQCNVAFAHDGKVYIKKDKSLIGNGKSYLVFNFLDWSCVVTKKIEKVLYLNKDNTRNNVVDNSFIKTDNSLFLIFCLIMQGVIIQTETSVYKTSYEDKIIKSVIDIDKTNIKTGNSLKKNEQDKKYSIGNKYIETGFLIFCLIMRGVIIQTETSVYKTSYEDKTIEPLIDDDKTIEPLIDIDKTNIKTGDSLKNDEQDKKYSIVNKYTVIGFFIFCLIMQKYLRYKIIDWLHNVSVSW